MKRAPDQLYLETSIATASKEDLIVKIFDFLVINATQALEKLGNDRDDVEGIHKALLRSQRALALLMGSLDMEVGGEVARNLFRVYEFWHHELVMANMQKDRERVERLLPSFKDYRQMWAQAVTQFKNAHREPAAAPPVASGQGFAAVG
jgi:flagellar protein FliS